MSDCLRIPGAVHLDPWVVSWIMVSELLFGDPSSNFTSVWMLVDLTPVETAGESGRVAQCHHIRWM